MTPWATGMTLNSLDTLVAIHCDQSSIDLIKCDVDGHDVAVLQSGSAILAREEPLLYFDAEMNPEDAIAKALNFFNELSKNGYSKFSAFDNFGLLLAENISPDLLCELFRYVLHQNQKRSTRTFYYIDVLCSTQKHRAAHIAALQHYKSTWFSRIWPNCPQL